jgi:hypothetical protein
MNANRAVDCKDSKLSQIIRSPSKLDVIEAPDLSKLQIWIREPSQETPNVTPEMLTPTTPQVPTFGGGSDEVQRDVFVVGEAVGLLVGEAAMVGD